MFIVFDLDDTLADTSHRQHILDGADLKDSNVWNTFFDACDKDKPKNEIIEVLDALQITGFHRIEIWTGRSNRVYEKTVTWLQKYIYDESSVLIRMRQEGDYRHDTEIKAEMMQEFGRPDLVFDDRNSVVKWWREQGITCCQVKESDF